MLNISKRFLSTALVSTAVLAVSATVALQPALALNAARTLAGITSCSSSLPCSGWNNAGSGTAVQGTASATDGVKGFTTGTGKSGVYGETDASAGGYGLHGANSAANGFAVYGLGRSGVGVWANAFGSKPSVLSNAAGGDAADLFSSSGIGAVIGAGSNASNGINHELGVFAASSKPGSIIGGVAYGAVITSGQDGIPLIVRGTSGDVSIDSTGTIGATGNIDAGGNISANGNVIYGGELIGPSETRTAGVSVTSYITKTTQANVEDIGTAQLVNGTALVRLDLNYAQTIDMRTPYRVFLTPGGDSRGLYVAQKTATGFVVRESQAGHGTYSFDYRIIGSALGRTTERMAVLTPALKAKFKLRKP